MMETEQTTATQVLTPDVIIPKPDTEATTAPEQNQPLELVQRTIRINTHLIDIKLKGLTNGVIDVPANFFEEWIVKDNDLEFTSRKLDEKRAKLLQLQGKINSIELKQEESDRQANVLGAELSVLTQQYENIKAKVDEIKKTLLGIDEKLKSYHRPYAGVLGFIFILGSFFFILADLSILEQTFDDLGFDEGDGLWDNPRRKLSLGFAASLLALKPAMDFIIERYHFNEPNMKDSRIKARNIVYALVAVLVLACITLLSWHRAIAHQVDDNSSMPIYIAMLLSGPAFALGGALLLSVGHKNMKVGMMRYYYLNKCKRIIKNKLTPVEKERDEILKSKLTKEGDLKTFENGNQIKNELQIYYQEANQLTTEIARLDESMNNLLNEKEKAIYRDAVEVGKKYELQGKLLVSPAELYAYADTPDNYHTGNTKPGTNYSGNKPVPRPRRPYVMIRKMIAKNNFQANAEQIDVSDN
jgi:prefoldin subunit 5